MCNNALGIIVDTEVLPCLQHVTRDLIGADGTEVTVKRDPKTDALG